ncbi:MAG: protein arginine kinase [Clostridia bacterium]|nr:protein arginine kinase [Clostridia bacterium]
MNCWYTQSAKEDDIVISSRIRLARNLKNIPFPIKMDTNDFQKINETVKNAVKSSNTPYAKNLKFIYMKDVPQNERYAMVERHIISKEFASNCENKAIILSEDESISIMIGEEDHIRLQVLLPGLQIEKAYDIAESIDRLLCDTLDIAFDNRLGFLTECPTNLGTGLRASVMVHLPIIEGSGEIKILADSVNKIGFTVRGMYGEGSKPTASFYQISNQITLGISEKNAIDNLNIITKQIIEKERKNRESINRLKAEDICMRALGTLKYAKILDSSEMMKALSEIKLGLSIGVMDDERIMPIKLLVEGQPFMLMRKFGEMSPDERDVCRATMIREALS